MGDSKDEIIKNIRQGIRRRVEERHRIRQLKQEQREELEENAHGLFDRKPSFYIPYILISLVFLSFPLSEPNVDWMLVGCFLLLNGLWTLFFSSSSLLNWVFMILANITLIHWSFILSDLPRIISGLNPKNVALCIGGNFAAIIFLYYAYVERRVPWKGLIGGSKKKKTKCATHVASNKLNALEEFARRRTRMDRIDIAASALIVANLFVLTFLGFIPKEVFFILYRQIMGLLH